MTTGACLFFGFVPPQAVTQRQTPSIAAKRAMRLRSHDQNGPCERFAAPPAPPDNRRLGIVSRVARLDERVLGVDDFERGRFAGLIAQD